VDVTLTQPIHLQQKCRTPVAVFDSYLLPEFKPGDSFAICLGLATHTLSIQKMKMTAISLSRRESKSAHLKLGIVIEGFFKIVHTS